MIFSQSLISSHHHSLHAQNASPYSHTTTSPMTNILIEIRKISCQKNLYNPPLSPPIDLFFFPPHPIYKQSGKLRASAIEPGCRTRRWRWLPGDYGQHTTMPGGIDRSGPPAPFTNAVASASPTTSSPSTEPTSNPRSVSLPCRDFLISLYIPVVAGR